MARIGTILSNAFHMAKGVVLDVKTIGNELRSNRVIGGTIKAVSNTFQKQGGKVAGETLGRHVEKLARANERVKMYQRALDYATMKGRNAVKIGDKLFTTGQIEQMLDVAQKSAERYSAIANEAAARLVGAARKAIGAGAKAWFMPEMIDPALGRRDWGAWAARMGITAAGLIGLGTLGRELTDSGSMFFNEQGDFDIAGLPFV